MAAVADPLGGSYFVEKLTDEMEARALAYMNKIDEMGGIVRAIEEGYPQREIANSAYQFQRQVDAGERAIVGVNKYQSGQKDKIQLLKIEPQVERTQVERCQVTRQNRNAERAAAALEGVRAAARGSDPHEHNLMVAVLHAVKAHVTLGEVCDVFREVFGEHTDPAYL